ncbi:gluconokinase [Calidifontimicrobium sp. SYSU G02091]|uniref:gluconokinase n=1 Tax=Calidifontimicrobium sp. SYSU G02091 TaxID=2926421 RepID=UPI001F52C5CC|nr:gluconokinase [Calidifontimicrobium sp. SYSU G02091]MCI1191818.1 gluconokinase [Calidifontimicrobium sp. SYSU G02091]
MDSVIVMGVAGCGKSSLGRALAASLGRPLIEGDDFHPPANVAKMRAGVALTDADRAGWLDALADALRAHPGGAVLTCSALKRSYRDRLRAAAPGVRFVHLTLDRDEALRRVTARAAEHLFPPALVDSQFEALEPPLHESAVLTLDATRPLVELTAHAVRWLGALAAATVAGAPR